MTLPPRAVLLGEARRFREALLNARPHLSPRLQSFPNGTGLSVALLLERHFYTLDLTTQTRFVSTHLHQVPLSHAWLQLGPYHLDLTAGQFTPAHPLYLKAAVPPWMQAYPAAPYGVLEAFDEETRQMLERDLCRIREALAHQKGNRRFLAPSSRPPATGRAQSTHLWILPHCPEPEPPRYQTLPVLPPPSFPHATSAR